MVAPHDPATPAGATALPSWLGWDDGWSHEYAQVDGSAICKRLRELCGPAEPARVIRADRSHVEVLAAAGPARGTWGADLVAETAADPTQAPTTGDFVWLQHWADGRSTVERVLPRRTAIVRASASGRSQGQVLAANMDTVAVVESLIPEPQEARMERLLTLAWDSGATPLVILTKADLCDDADEIAADLAVRVAPGVEVLVTSAPTGVGLEPIAELCDAGRTIALVGGSGAGKSTLLNALAGTEVMATNELATFGKGRHTTVTRELHRSQWGGSVIDTPGLRGVGLLDSGGLAAVFPEVEELAAQCRFADCGHDTEPGCAVQAAVEAGDLPEERLARWRKLQREAEWVASRTDARLRKAREQEWKVINKSMRANRIRP